MVRNAYGRVEFGGTLHVCNNGNRNQIDNGGRLLRVSAVLKPGAVTCSDRGRLQLTAFDGDSEEVIGYMDDRCGPSGPDRIRHIGIESGVGQIDDPKDAGFMVFDDKNGRLHLMLSSCVAGIGCAAPDRAWVATIDGFATAFDIFQSYTPTSGPLTFKVPAIPEGFPAADSFDTYHGQLGNYDFSLGRDPSVLLACVE